MKSGIHPQLNPVVFVDGDHEFVTLSTLRSTTTRDIDGVEHFVIPVEISSASHPFFTGEQRIIDTAGQVERFMRRLEAGVSQREDDLRREADPVDWVELIPFDETRNYVMRVTESLPNYRARRTGETGPVRFTDELKQR